MGEKHNWIVRKKLINRIDKISGVVVLVAEGGAGKSTLASQWIRSSGANETFLWCGFETRDGNAELAWRTFLLALAPSDPERFREVFMDYDRGFLAVDDLPGIVRSCLLMMHGPVPVVLDDLHETHKEFQQQLCKVFQNLAHVKLVITSRYPTAFEDDLMLRASGLESIGSAELALSLEEVDLMTKSTFEDGPVDLVERIHRVFRGQMLITQLALSRMKIETKDQQLHRFDDAYLRGIVRSVGRDAPTFASEIESHVAHLVALCPDMTPSLFLKLFDRTHVTWEVIESFELQGLGQIRKQGSTCSFRFHALIHAALAEQSHQSLELSAKRLVRSIAFEELESVSGLLELFKLGIYSDLDFELFEFFARNFSEITLVRSQEVISLLNALPRGRLNRSWPLPLMLSILLSETQVRTSLMAKELIAVAMRNLRQAARETCAPEENALFSLAWFAAHRIAREYSTAVKHVDQYLREVSKTTSLERSVAEVKFLPVLVQACITRLLSGDIEGAKQLAEMVTADEHDGRRAHLGGLHCFLLTMTGELAVSQQVHRGLEELRKPKGWESGLTSIGWRLSGYLLLANEGKVDEALKQVGLVADEMSSYELWPAFYWTRAQLRLIGNQCETGLLELTTLTERAEELPVSSWWRDRLHVVA